MALCLAESLIAYPNLDQKDLLDRFCLWASKGENTSTGVCVGIGQNTLRVLGNFHRTGTLNAPETRQKSDGNGAAMRLAPVAVERQPLCPRATTTLAGFVAAEVGLSFSFSG
jgi:ADP-ribosylglycohydrolase